MTQFENEQELEKHRFGQINIGLTLIFVVIGVANLVANLAYIESIKGCLFG
jgi:hypothetical protein